MASNNQIFVAWRDPDRPIRYRFSTDGGQADSLFKEARADMIINGPWVLGDYRTSLGDDLPDQPVAEYKRRIGPWILWRAGPASKGHARYWAAHEDDARLIPWLIDVAAGS